jgi:hypothetical protein
MSRSFGFIATLIVVGIGGYVYVKQTQTVTHLGTTAITAIDLTAVRNDLIAIANAERRYWATKAKYASIEELRANGDIYIPSRANCNYTIEATENNFKIIATYSGPSQNGPKRISMDETMEMKTE